MVRTKFISEIFNCAKQICGSTTKIQFLFKIFEDWKQFIGWKTVFTSANVKSRAFELRLIPLVHTLRNKLVKGGTSS